MFLQKELEWIAPLALIKKIPESQKCWALLYSAMRMDFTGRYSYLAIQPRREIISDDFPSEFKNGRWFGYFGYGLKNHLEKLPEDPPGIINLPNLWLVNYRTVLIFDHDEKKIEVRSDGEFSIAQFFLNNPSSCGTQSVSAGSDHVQMPSGISQDDKMLKIKSNMTKAEYLSKVAAIKEYIAAGDVYQANLTRKFYGEFEKPPAPTAIFEKLCEISPAPYSCLMKLDDNYIISSSPEMFLKIAADGAMESRPIKGSAPENAKRQELQQSKKDRAENLMIVDLVRNDLSRGCLPGSVKAESMFDVTSYSTLHHMSSTITGRKRPDVSSLQIIKDCFPPGSMTGAPKIKAMEICSRLENMARGVYSGAIGWIDSSGAAELSVIIRTMILKGNIFEFQVGGAIVHDSDPEAEWRETIFKARGLTETLGIKNLI